MARKSLIAVVSERVRRDKKKSIICAVALMLFTIWIGGLFSQMTGLAGIFSPFDDSSISFHITVNPFKCAIMFFRNLPNSLMVPLFIYFLIGMYALIKWKDHTMLDTEMDERGFQMENSGTYGTSRIMKEENIKDYLEVEPLERTKGTIIGRIPASSDAPNVKGPVVSIPPDGKHFKYDAFGRLAVKKNPDGTQEPVRVKFKSNTNKHIMAIGASGCGKSFCFARPSIFQAILRKESIIVTDPKGELYSDTARYAEERGYTVKILNLDYLQGSDSWDCLAELKGSPQIGIEAQKFCHIIIENTSNPNGGGDEIYANGEENLLTALILYVLTAPDPEFAGKATLGSVYELLAKEEEELKAKFDLLPDDNAAKKPWNIFITASNNLRGNLKLGLGTRLRVLQDGIVQKVTGVPDISLTLPGETPCAYFVIMPVMHETFRFISSLFFSCLFDKLFALAMSRPSQTLDVPVSVIMDEFIAIGKIPDFEKKLATVRSAGIAISMIFQNLAQLQLEYPDNMWESLLSNCSNLICLACNDMSTAKYLSERAGVGTIALDSKRVSRSLLNVGAPEEVAHSYSVGERNVMQETEIIKLASEGKLIAVPAGGDIIVLEKFPYTDLVDPTTLERINMRDHTPAWAQQEKVYRMRPEIKDPPDSYVPRKAATQKEEPPVEASQGVGQEENIPAQTTADNDINSDDDDYDVSDDTEETTNNQSVATDDSVNNKASNSNKQKRVNERLSSSSNIANGAEIVNDF